MEAELTVAFLAFTERYTSRVTCVPYESVKVRFLFHYYFYVIYNDFFFWVGSYVIGCRGIGYASV